MAEEAMLSYQQSTAFLRENASQFSGADLAALQAAMREEVSSGNNLLGHFWTALIILFVTFHLSTSI